jgi:hypothetical protein
LQSYSRTFVMLESFVVTGSTVPLLDGKDYVAFDLEWTNNGDSDTGNQTIYAAAFVDNHGNQKVLHISDFGNSEPALLQAITEKSS